MNNAQLILGTAQIEAGYGVTREKSPRPESWSEIMFEARKTGFTALDTAFLYPNAHQIIGNSDWDRQVHTKFPSLSTMKDDFRDAQKKLKRREIDLVYFHRSPKTIEEARTMHRLATELKEEGAKYLGISVYSPSELGPVFDSEDISFVQIPLSVLDQRFLEEHISILQSYGKHVVVRSVFLQGLLASEASTDLFRFVPQPLIQFVERFRNAAALRGRSPSQFALDFIRSVPGIMGVIIGCETIRQVQVSSHAWTKSIESATSRDEFAALRAVNDLLLDPRLW